MRQTRDLVEKGGDNKLKPELNSSLWGGVITPWEVREGSRTLLLPLTLEVDV